MFIQHREKLHTRASLKSFSLGLMSFCLVLSLATTALHAETAKPGKTGKADVDATKTVKPNKKNELASDEGGNTPQGTQIQCGRGNPLTGLGVPTTGPAPGTSKPLCPGAQAK